MQKESLKAIMDYVKSFSLSFLTALYAVIAYGFINRSNFTKNESLIVCIVAFVLFIGILGLTFLFIRLSKKLENLEKDVK